MSTECGWCGDELTAEEVEYPATDFRGEKIDEPICDDCFHEHYEFTCDRCCEYDYEEYSGMWVVVHEETHGLYGPVEPGVYEVVDWPIQGGPIIGSGWLYNDALRKTKVAIDFEQEDYPCSHLCSRCAKELKLRHSKAGRKFHKERLARPAAAKGE